MLEVQLDIPEALIALLGPEFEQALLDDLGAAARAKWIRLAQTELQTSKRDYIQGIQEVTGEGQERIVALTGWLPNAVENGLGSFDMRETLLGPGKGHTAKDGSRYRAIPFRHGTPGTAGGVGAAMGMRMGPQGPSSLGALGGMSVGAAAALGKDIYKAAKRLKPGQSLKTGGMGIPKLSLHHKSDIFAGMRREAFAGPLARGKARQSQYTTFRTISTKTTTGWIHPGIQARHLAVRVQAHIQEAAEQAITVALRAAFGKV
jgi:hypothetical protein